MTTEQELWWKQACSDWKLYQELKKHGHPTCHQLLFLQMAAEKISKAYFWRSGQAPRKTHAGFAQFVRTLPCSTRNAERDRVAMLLGFPNYKAMGSWARKGLPIAYELEKLAPALAQDGVNTEYPWPNTNPTSAPIEHDYVLGHRLSDTSEGRQFLRFFGRAVEQFSAYA